MQGRRLFCTAACVAAGALLLVACVAPLAPGTSTPQSMSVVATNILARAVTDRPDEVAGYQVHVVYAVPSDGADHRRDEHGEIARSVSAFETWLAGQTGGTKLLLDTAGGGGLDVSFIRLAQSDAEIASAGAFARDRIEQLMRDAGLNHGAKLYAVYYDGSNELGCGFGPSSSDGGRGHVGVMFLQGLAHGPKPCNTNLLGADAARPGYLDISMLHEIFHALGAVAPCAPHRSTPGHVGDSPADLMYAGSQPWLPTTLDVGHDDYYGHPANGCLDVSGSTFLNPQPAAQQLPPNW